MRIVYKRSLAFLALLIVFVGCIGIGYLFYDQVIDPETLVVVNDELSINYLDSSTITQDGEYRFSVTNSGTNDVYYEIRLTDISGFSSDVTYTLSSTDASIQVEEAHLNSEDNMIMDNILIGSMETQNFTLSVSHNSSTTFKIEVEKTVDAEEYFYMTLLNQNEISTGEDGLFESEDDDGTTYYFRGNVENNYVLFAGLSWRIVRINGNGTVKLVLDGVDDTVVRYNEEATGYEDFKETDVYDALVSYYDNHLNNYDKYIANNRYCSESGKSDDTYNAYTRIVTNEIPTFNCLGKRFTSKIGLLTADEVVYAGGVYDEENTAYYLYNSEIKSAWWVSSLSNSDGDDYYPFVVGSNGDLNDDASGTLYRSLRPVISLNRTVKVTGTGTSTDPYVVS